MKKLVNFAKSLLTNRLGIVLATPNLCYFVSSHFLSGLFQVSNFDKIMLSLNAPAIVPSLVAHRLMRFLFLETDGLTLRRWSFVFLLFFVALQWLAICWTAKTIARKLKAD